MEKQENCMQDFKYGILRDQYLESGNRPRLYRIRALRDIPEMDVKAGDFGGWIDDTSWLSHTGSCWIGDCAMVYDGSIVQDDAFVGGKSEVSRGSLVSDYSVVNHDVIVYDSSIKDDTRLFGKAEVRESVLSGEIEAYGRTIITSSNLYGKIRIEGAAKIDKCDNLCGNDIVIGRNASLCCDNYTVIGPLDTVGNVAFYLGQGKVLYSFYGEIFDNPYKLIKRLHSITNIPTRSLRKIVLSVTDCLMP